MPQIAQRVSGFGTTIFTAINELAAQYDVVNLGQGKPDFDGPDSMLQAAADAMRDGLANQYPPGYGVPQLRQQIAQTVGHHYNLDVDPQAGVVVTNGATGGIFTSVLGVVDAGDEVILIEPYYDVYLNAVLIAGGKPVYVSMHPPQWRIDPDDLRAAFNANTRAIILNTPHNPTGRVLSYDELALIAALCREYDVIAICDEVYEFMTYGDNRHIPLATLPDMFERTLTISSAAKTFSVTGWKIGWVYGHPDLITGVWRVHQNTTFTANHPAQIGVAHALALGDDYLRDFRAMYAQKQAILLQALINAGLKPTPPQGAFYIMADFSDVFTGDDVAFTRYLISEIGVACIPPTAFYCDAHQSLGASYVRFAYGKYDDALQEAARRLSRLAQA